jgi:hypothetical protein
MADISTETLKAPRDGMRGSITPGDEREIILDKDLGERKAGKVYVVDSALAAHYCDTLKVARYVEQPAGNDPAPVEDRAMKPPPRGRGKKE